MAKLPPVWATAADVADHFGISVRRLRSLCKEWEDLGLLIEGKHCWRFGPRQLRFDIDAMHKLGHSQGRVMPSLPPVLSGNRIHRIRCHTSHQSD